MIIIMRTWRSRTTLSMYYIMVSEQLNQNRCALSSSLNDRSVKLLSSGQRIEVSKATSLTDNHGCEHSKKKLPGYSDLCERPEI